jgi:serine/threonine-protein kinase
MELVEGGDLRRLIGASRRLAPDRALQIFEEVLRALAVAHGAGIIHRDLKPENILIASDGGVKVTDFELGSARQDSARPALLSAGLDTAAPGGIVGTLAYMAPEQLAGEAVDARADIYALGIILFEMLTGERPHPGDQPSQLVPGLPAKVDALFQKCYTRREKRFASALAALEAVNTDRVAEVPIASMSTS